MKITVNNKEIIVEGDTSVAGLLSQLSYGVWVTVYINGRKLLEREYETTVLRESDEVTIIRILAGG